MSQRPRAKMYEQAIMSLEEAHNQIKRAFDRLQTENQVEHLRFSTTLENHEISLFYLKVLILILAYKW
jgi:hypothetical protein